MATNDPPGSGILHPHAGHQDAVLDDPTERPDAPVCVDCANYEVVEDGRIPQFGSDLLDSVPPDGVEPLLAVHDEWTSRSRADQQELLVGKRIQLPEVLPAQGFAPIVLELFDERSLNPRFGCFLRGHIVEMTSRRLRS